MAAVIPTAGESLGAWLDAAIDALLTVAIDSLEEPAIRAELVADERRIRRLQARSTNLAAARERQGRGCPQPPEVRAACVLPVCHHWIERQFDSGGRR